MPCQQITNTGLSYSPPLSSRSGPFTSEADCLQACKEGACCEGATCSVKPQCQCQGTGQTFKGVGTTCTPSVETMTLTFTAPGDTTPVGEYANFLPTCSNYMPRYSMPIVLRRNPGSIYYLSDPILFGACEERVYGFDACAASLVVSPPGARIFGAASPGNWGNATYSFGDFAQITPGGAYQPETRLLCNGTIETKLSLLEGCGGTRCPPGEIQVRIDGGDVPPLAGTYAVPLGLPSGPCMVAGYFQRFLRESDAVVISVGWVRDGSCGCDEQRLVLYRIEWEVLGGGSQAVAFRGPAQGNTTISLFGGCGGVCPGENATQVFNGVKVLYNSNLYNIGNVTVIM